MTEITAHHTPSAVTATTPLPAGWRAFCSTPDHTTGPHWYATAPYDAYAVNRQHAFPGGRSLSQTVDAHSWPELHRKVAHEVQLYEMLIGDFW